MSDSELRYAKYGKDNVRLYKVHKDSETGIQSVVEFTVTTLLEGDIETSSVHAPIYNRYPNRLDSPMRTILSLCPPTLRNRQPSSSPKRTQ